MPMTILDRIVEEKRSEVSRRKRDTPPSDLRESVHYGRTPADLRASLEASPVFGIIAEIKRTSPAAGALRPSADPGAIALAYTAAGAAGISVLTDATFFGGSLTDLTNVRDRTALPLLRKDFLIDPYQIAEAKAAGADAVLLIAAILDRGHLDELFSAAAELGLGCLVELYEDHEIDILDTDRMKLIGVNNRDLRSFEIRKDHAIRVARLLPRDVTVVSESGIGGPADLRRLRTAGIRAALIGEYCMKADSPGDALRELLEGAAA